MSRIDETLQVQLPNLEPLRVLVVEDDALVRERLRALINHLGHTAVEANSVAEARALFAEQPCQIAIVDRNLGDEDGVALCTELRARNVDAYVYILLLTVRDSDNEVVAGLEAGADDYVSKKRSDAELLARLRSATRIVKLERTLRLALEDRTRAAETDSLTKGHNRRYFKKQIDLEWKRAMRFNKRLSLLMLDIDYFKQVNDKFGHAAGDEVLQGFARRLSKALPRTIDWVARLGGEEFVVVLPETDLSGATVVAERLRSAVEVAPIATSLGSISITVSVGIGSMGALPAEQGANPQALLDQADFFLYRSKLAGRNRVSGP